MEKTITDKQQDLNQYLVYEARLNALDVQNMSPKDKIKHYINSSQIDVDADTVIYLAEAAFGIELN
jgi:hypothetical protein